MSTNALLQQIKTIYSRWQAAQTRVDTIKQRLSQGLGSDLDNAKELTQAAALAYYYGFERRQLLFELMLHVSYRRFKKLNTISGGPWL